MEKLRGYGNKGKEKSENKKKHTLPQLKRLGWVNKKKNNMNSGGGNTVNSVVKYQEKLLMCTEYIQDIKEGKPHGINKYY